MVVDNKPTPMKVRFSLIQSLTAIGVVLCTLSGCKSEEVLGETPASRAEMAKAAAGWSPEMVEKFKIANARARTGQDDTPQNVNQLSGPLAPAQTSSSSSNKTSKK